MPQGGSAESITARYAKYAQRCIPRVHASAFSHGDQRTRIYVGKHRRERGRAFLPSHYLFALLLSLPPFPFLPPSPPSVLSLALSPSPSLPLLFTILGLFPSRARRRPYEKESFSSFLFPIQTRYRGYHGPERLFHTSARAGIRK